MLQPKRKNKTEFYEGGLCKLIDDKATDFILVKNERILKDTPVVLHVGTFGWSKPYSANDYQIVEYSQQEQIREIDCPNWVIFLRKILISTKQIRKIKTRKRALVIGDKGLWIIPLHCLEQQNRLKSANKVQIQDNMGYPEFRERQC